MKINCIKLSKELEKNRNKLYSFFKSLSEKESSFVLRGDFTAAVEDFFENNPDLQDSMPNLSELKRVTQEVSVNYPSIYFMFRESIGSWNFIAVNANDLRAEEISASEYLKVKEQLTGSEIDEYMTEVDFSPFSRDFPVLKEVRSIGNGVHYLNRHLSGRLFLEGREGSKKLLDFLRIHKCSDSQLMVDKSISSVKRLKESLREGISMISSLPEETVWDDISRELSGLGFRPGWGRAVRDIESMFNSLLDILEAPDHINLEKFLAKIPMIFDIALISPHGYFGQENVLGMPDTGGQVVYILDQVKALEKEMKEQIKAQGLDIAPKIVILSRLIPESDGTTCNVREEKVYGTENVWILRVPFRYENGEVVRQWISRFRIWPYLEDFARESSSELVSFFGKRPDLIIGNYSDGNLVGHLISKRLKVTQCNIAHALEKAKYLFSDLYWFDNKDYNFAVQYTADLISMNAADFIITSTYQEIAGTRDSMGQYESYSNYTLPGLYRVVNGINVFDPKFNIVSPGADEMFYYPYYKKENRITDAHDDLEQLIYGDPDGKSRGKIQKNGKKLIFTMARLDKVKNITGLVEAYGKDKELQKKANLFIIAGNTDVNSSSDNEERYQIELMHRLFDEYGLDDKVRWLGVHLQKSLAGELYRYVADMEGIFVQPAIFEAFGLTVIEAMATGLPVFATQYGGPLEIIDHNKCGFHIDPNDCADITGKILDFIEKCENESGYWKKFSDASVKRVEERYTWKLNVKKLLTLARVYGFWHYVTNLEKEETSRYIDMFYGLMHRKLVSESEK